MQCGRYRYSRHSAYKIENPKCLWICIQSYVGCRASVYTFDNEVLRSETLCFSEINFTVSQRGNPVIQYGRYRFSRHSDYKRGSPRCRWVCIRVNYGCQLHFIVSKKGKPMIQYGGYRFSRHSEGNLKCRWVCVKTWSGGCRATIYTYKDVVIKINNVHNH
ncbi:Uncharacterized protein OBRU01_26917, partial [Operophtera brumata]